MTAPLTSAEARFHASLPHFDDSRLWRVTPDGHFWVRCCDVESAIRYDDAAEAQDAALYHLKHCPEARRG
ncbi:hypothetical protein KGD82_13365 [Nocardiopsis eucommiae]|uniref:Uncharacterized protein n=1 Tax=Nocardiopsis eucommiae TaxID=2831970 RepID=A0A975QLX8_9ACTN|nr:hypothetical protein KGD82_13365 [Nocardiopsis eucommiae]